LQLNMTDDDVKKVTEQIKALADQKKLSLDDVDVLLRTYHSQIMDEQHISVLPDSVGD
jgi:homocitrate synthase